MLNVVSILVGVVALLLAIRRRSRSSAGATGSCLPIAVVGIGLGALSRSNHGRNFCLVCSSIACLRLMLGGGII
jgi:hypothetical protein